MIKSQITLKQLEAFAFVVDVGTFRAAAGALGTTQPNISARIAALEAALDVVLLYRDAGSVRLTESGEALLPRAREVLWAAEAFLDIAGRRDVIEDRLRLGVTELIACTWLQDLLRRIKATYPGVRVELEVALSKDIERALIENRLDIAIHTGAVNGAPYRSLALGAQPYTWVAAPSVARALGSVPDLDSIFAHPVLTHARHTRAAQDLHKTAREAGLPTAQIVHSSALSACVPMVADGMGVGLLPHSLVKAEVKTGHLIEIACEWNATPLAFFARFDPRRAPPFVRACADLAVEVSKAHIG